jgi:beta-aspartyl-peptidase (threonine type)
MNFIPGIAIHGGAGTIERHLLGAELEKQYLAALSEALQSGYRVIEAGGDAMDAVCASVISMEDCPLFNAGRGSVFNSEGRHEMDAAVMTGHNLEAGAVCGVKNIKNPVQLARMVMEVSSHVMMSGAGAEEFGREHGIHFEEDSYFHTDFRKKQWEELRGSEESSLDHNGGERKFGTVGAVALDRSGNLAAATSTGGMTNKKFGRIGDTPVIGAGTYANNKTCAVSCTGHGEFYLRSVVAYDLSCLMEYKGMSLEEAASYVVNDKLVKIGGEGGLIAIDLAGNICMPFNSSGMYRACRSAGEKEKLGIYR